MIISDMDGTLLDSNEDILESSKKVLRKLKQNGKIIVIATGRCINHSLGYLSDDFVDYLLANNGAVWYSLSEKRIIEKNIINSKDCIEILNTYCEFISHVYLTDDNISRFDNVTDAINYLNNHNDIICMSIQFKNYKECKNVANILKDKYNNLYTQLMQDSFSEHQWIDISGKDNNKGLNIKKLSKCLNINYDDTICFGDGLNDVEMFKNVKTSVAMANALPELKQVATHITDTNDNDGIAKFLNSYYFEYKKGE